MAIFRIEDVMRVTGLSKTTVYKYLKRGTFPALVRLTDRAVGWRAADIQAWIASRPTATDVPPMVPPPARRGPRKPGGGSLTA